MVTAFNILYSAAAVRRLLGLRSSAQVELKEFARVIWVWVKGQRPTFISKAVFQAALCRMAQGSEQEPEGYRAVRSSQYLHRSQRVQRNNLYP